MREPLADVDLTAEIQSSIGDGVFVHVAVALLGSHDSAENAYDNK